jgi:ubiquinone/menaquinone biosynthesis C-methylase UbiE
MENTLTIQNAKKNKEILFWPVSEQLEDLLSTSVRDTTVNRIMEQENIEMGAISQSSTTPSMLRDLLSVANASYNLPKLHGVGIELGAGIGLLGIVAAENSKVEAILSIEVVKSFVTNVIPEAAFQILKSNSNKIIPVYGSFEDIKIESNQIDFALQIESLHHADSLDLAASETFRVLKPGGFLLSIDRSHPDNVSDKTLTELLDHVYPEGFLVKRGYPTNIKLTRRENGEHEIRDLEWKKSFENAGFVTETFKFISPKLEMWHVKKRFACLFLMWTKKGRNIKIPIRKGVIRGYILQLLGIKKSMFGAIAKGNQERWMTVMVFRKPKN